MKERSRLTKKKVKEVLIITTGTVVALGVTLFVGKKMKAHDRLGKKILDAFKTKSNCIEMAEDGLIAWIDMDADELVCAIDVPNGNVGEVLDKLKKAENFFTENLAF